MSTQTLRKRSAARSTAKRAAHRRSLALWELARYTVLAVCGLIFVIPFVWLATLAVKSEAEIARNPFGLPLRPEWGNLVRTWNEGRYSIYLPNTVIYAVSIVAGTCAVSCLAGYALGRIRFPGHNMVFVGMLIGLMVPFQSLMIPMYYLARDLQILGTRWGLILPMIALEVSFGTFLMRAFFRGLPEELADAARIDGCTEWGVFRRVMLPLASPGVMTLAVFTFVRTWSAFLQPLVLVQRDELRPVSLALLFFTGRFGVDRGMRAAAVMLTIVPVLLVYILLQRRFIDGVTAGALK